MARGHYFPKLTENGMDEMHRITMLNDMTGMQAIEFSEKCRAYAMSMKTATFDTRDIYCGDVTKVAEDMGYKV